MIRRPPRSTRTDTLFPYTTLFRSAWLDEDRRHLGAYARARAVFVHFDRARALGVQSGPVAGGPAGRRPQRRRLLWAAGMAACLCVVATLQLLGAGHHATATGEILRVPRSEERRVGQECVSTCRSRW